MVFVEYNYFVGRYKNFFGELSDENNEFVFLRFWKFWKENLKYFIGVCFFNYNVCIGKFLYVLVIIEKVNFGNCI